jgi:hypothetical protein
LGVRGHIGAEFGLDACEGAVKLFRGGGAALNFAEGLVENFGDIEQTDNIALFITDGLIYCALEFVCPI